MGLLPNTLLALALFLLAGHSAAQRNLGTINISFPEHPPQSALSNPVNDNFLGISWELSSFDTLWGFTADKLPDAMQNYLHNIRARISNPLRMRIGGNGMDISTYDPDKTDVMLQLTDPDAYFNDIPCTFGPVFFDVLNAMSDKVGDMSYILGLPMRQPEFYDNAVLLAKAAQEKLGDKLDALLIGNEPDLYQKHGHKDQYGISDYVPDIGGFLELMEDDDAFNANKTNVGGPTVCCNWNLDDVISAGLDKYPYKYYTYQHYPTHFCAGPNAENTNMTYFVTHPNVRPYVHWEDGNWKGILEAKQAGVPVLMTEYNSVSCGGSNISDTFAMPLWATDVALSAAGSNISGIFLHTREFDITYNLFDPPSAHDPNQTGWRTGPIYYTTLVVAETLSATGSVVVDLELNSTHAVGYGVYDDNGDTRGKLVFINYASKETLPSSLSDRNTSYTFHIPENVTDSIGVRYLVAPGLYSGSRSWGTEDETITWAGQTVGEVGDLGGKQETSFIKCSQGCDVDVPGPGLALVYLLSDTSDTFFHGNSTVALPLGNEGDDSGARSFGLGMSGVLVWAGSVVLSIALGWV
ncbi:unnamed protein product [Somion occarium]|uniref:Beta-glucuronidase C-terminal domain-containing protein n=1 Tax=Somion occarium TaxID=3059160 RepID=A0ABP1E783_9APHY